MPVAPLAARLLQVPSGKIIEDPKMLVKGALKIQEFFHPQGLICYYDSKLEAEALGCLTVLGQQDNKINNLKLTVQIRVPNFKKNQKIKRTPKALKATNMLYEALGCDPAIFAAVSCPVELGKTIIGKNEIIKCLNTDNNTFIQKLSEHLIWLIKQYLEHKIDVLVVIGCWEFFSNQKVVNIYNSFFAVAGKIAAQYRVPLVLYLQGKINQIEHQKQIIEMNVQGLAVDLPVKLNEFNYFSLIETKKIICFVIPEETLYLETSELKNYLENVTEKFSDMPIMLSLPWKLSTKMSTFSSQSTLLELFDININSGY